MLNKVNYFLLELIHENINQSCHTWWFGRFCFHTHSLYGRWKLFDNQRVGFNFSRFGINFVESPKFHIQDRLLFSKKKKVKFMELTTCLWFNGQARQAALFYTSIFPNSSIEDHWITPVDTPGNKEGEEVYVNFKIFNQSFIGLNGGPQFPHTEAISFQIPCKDQAEVDHYWELLTKDGGQESQCGWLKDKFGISWQVIPIEMGKYSR